MTGYSILVSLGYLPARFYPSLVPTHSNVRRMHWMSFNENNKEFIQGTKSQLQVLRYDPCLSGGHLLLCLDAARSCALTHNLPLSVVAVVHLQLSLYTLLPT